MRVVGHDQPVTGCNNQFVREVLNMRSLLLLFLGVPLPIVILIALFSH
jgi:hypothetical protein